MTNEEWRQWLDESRAKQAQLDAMNQRNRQAASGNLPIGEFQPQQAPQYSQPMRGTFSAASIPTGGAENFPVAQSNGLPSGWGGEAPGYRPGIPSRTPEEIKAADDAWLVNQIARENQLAEWYNYSRVKDLPDAMAQQHSGVAPAPQASHRYDDTQWQRPGPGLEDQFGDVLAAVSAAGLVKNLATAGVRGLAGLGRQTPVAREAWEPAATWGRSGFKDPNLIPRTAASRSGGEVLEATTQAAPRVGQELAPYGLGAAQLPKPGPTSWPTGTMKPADLGWLRNSADPRGQQFFDVLRQYYNPLTQGSGWKMPPELSRLIQNFYARP